eukprot:319312_1
MVNTNLSRCVALVTFLLIGIRRFLACLWIRFCKILGPDSGIFIPATSNYVHKIVVVGDGFAEGLGDWVVLFGQAGPARQLTHLIHEDSSVRLHWRVINRGRSGSTSRQWIPGAASSLFNRTFSATDCKDVDVVVLLVGTIDLYRGEVGMPMSAMRKGVLDDYKEDELCDTVQNIQTAVKALLNLGVKHVVVGNVPSSGAGLTEVSGLAKRINRQLGLFASDNDMLGRVSIVRVNDPKLMRASCRAFDGLHFNSAGHKVLGGLLMEQLSAPLTKVEWPAVKERLGLGLASS